MTSPFSETSGTNPDGPYENGVIGVGVPAWGDAWAFAWANTWGFVQSRTPFQSTSGASPEVIYEEN